MLAVAGPVLFLSAALVKYRDASTLVSFALQFLLFASPVAYPPELVPAGWRPCCTSTRSPVRSGCCGRRSSATEVPPARYIALSAAVAVLGLLIGLLHFRRTEREFADII